MYKVMNTALYEKTFCEVFNITKDSLPGLKYQMIKEWDSVGHMALIAELETQFDIMMETEDIIDFSSYEIGMEILKKYGVSFS